MTLEEALWLIGAVLVAIPASIYFIQGAKARKREEGRDNS